MPSEVDYAAIYSYKNERYKLGLCKIDTVNFKV